MWSRFAGYRPVKSRSDGASLHAVEGSTLLPPTPEAPDTAQKAKQAKLELLVIVPLMAVTVFAYRPPRGTVRRRRGHARQGRLAAVAMVGLGWLLARDLGRSAAPALFRRMDPATAGTVGFLIRLS